MEFMPELVLVIALFGLAGEAQTSLTKEQILDRWAEALGGRENLPGMRTIHLRGSGTGGMNGTCERWATSHGEFRMPLEISGGFRQAGIFDGQKGWSLDSSGTSHALSGPGLRSVVGSAHETSGSFLFPGRIPGRVELTGEDANHDAYVLTPRAGRRQSLNDVSRPARLSPVTRGDHRTDGQPHHRLVRLPGILGREDRLRDPAIER